MCVYVTSCEEQTEALAALLAEGSKPGDVLLLEGGLGAGKTAFVRGLARGLGADASEVSSPTFALLHIYPGRLTLCHFDLYRLGPGEAEELGFEEYFFGTGVCAVEWPDRAASLLSGARTRTVRLEGSGEDTRTIKLEGFDALPEPGRLLALGIRRAQ